MPEEVLGDADRKVEKLFLYQGNYAPAGRGEQAIKINKQLTKVM